MLGWLAMLERGETDCSCSYCWPQLRWLRQFNIDGQTFFDTRRFCVERQKFDANLERPFPDVVMFFSLMTGAKFDVCLPSFRNDRGRCVIALSSVWQRLPADDECLRWRQYNPAFYVTCTKSCREMSKDSGRILTAFAMIMMMRIKQKVELSKQFLL